MTNLILGILLSTCLNGYAQTVARPNPLIGATDAQLRELCASRGGALYRNPTLSPEEVGIICASVRPGEDAVAPLPFTRGISRPSFLDSMRSAGQAGMGSVFANFQDQKKDESAPPSVAASSSDGNEDEAENADQGQSGDEKGKEKGKKRDINDPTQAGERGSVGKRAVYSVDWENKQGARAAAEINRQAKFVEDPVLNEWVNRLVDNIYMHSDAKGIYPPFAVKIIDSDEINAAALPGGFLYVNAGLLTAAENEAQVVGVLAHEVAHVARRHGANNATKGLFMRIGSVAAQILLPQTMGGYWIYQGIMQALGIGYLQFSKAQEKDADFFGAQYTYAAGYDPDQSAAFFGKIMSKKEKKGKKPGVLARVFSTHPLSSDRKADLTKKIKEHFPPKEAYHYDEMEFMDLRNRLLILQAERVRQMAVDEDDPTKPSLERRRKTKGVDSEDKDEAPEPQIRTTPPSDR